jgi:hypothetical protein
MARRGARLHRDDELDVLWLTCGRSELALSADGVWLRRGRRSADLTWDEVEQIQLGDPRGDEACLEIFPRDAPPCAAGPFPVALATTWIASAGASAAAAQRRPRALDGAPGFALPAPG